MNYTDLLTKTQAEIDDKFSPKKKQSLRLADVYDALMLPERADTVRGCGSFLRFSLTSSNASRLVYANFCKDRLCPACTWRRSLKVFRHVSKCLDFLEPLGYRYLFLTLTVKNCSADDLIKTIDLLNKAKYKLFKRARVQKFLRGAFCALEITYNARTGLFHPHLHCLLAVSSTYFTDFYLKQSEWAELWQVCADLDYLPVVDIRRVKTADLDVVGADVASVKLKNAVSEVAKYTLKDKQYLTGNLELDKFLVGTLSAALYKRKLCSFSGCFEEAHKKLNLDDAFDGDLVHLDDTIRSEIVVAIVQYHWRAGVYVRKVIEQEILPFNSPIPLEYRKAR